jgi:hypothetical protein
MLMRILSRTGSAGLTLVWPISGVVSRSWLCVCTSPDSPKVHALPSLQHKNRLQCPTPYQQTDLHSRQGQTEFSLKSTWGHLISRGKQGDLKSSSSCHTVVPSTPFCQNYPYDVRLCYILYVYILYVTIL